MTTKYADDTATEAARKQVEADKKLLEVSRAQYASRMKGKPTPTQEENDLAACGAHILTHEEDGSDPDPSANPGGATHDTKHLEAAQHKPQSYQTRQSKAE